VRVLKSSEHWRRWAAIERGERAVAGSVTPSTDSRGRHATFVPQCFMIKVVDPYFKVEMERLRAELVVAQRRTVLAFSPGSVLEGRSLGRLLAAHKKESRILLRIKELCTR